MLNTKTKIQLTNDSTGDFTWIDLPTTDKDAFDALSEIGVVGDEYEDDFDIFDPETYPAGFSITGIRSDLPIDKTTVGNYYLNEINEIIEEVEDLDDEDTWEAVLEYYSNNVPDALAAMRDYDIEFYSGIDLTELAEQFADEGVISNETLLQYIDYEALGDELRNNGYVETDKGVLSIQ